MALADDEIGTAGEKRSPRESSVAQLRQRHQCIVYIRINEIFCANLVGHPAILVDKHAEISAISNCTNIEGLLCLMASFRAVFVTACEKMVERGQLIEDSKRRLAPKEELFRLAILVRVNHD